MEQALRHARMIELVRSGDVEAAKRQMAASMDRTWVEVIYFS